MPTLIFLWDECVEKTVNCVKINKGKLIVQSQHQEAYWEFLAESDNTTANRRQKRTYPSESDNTIANRKQKKLLLWQQLSQ